MITHSSDLARCPVWAGRKVRLREIAPADRPALSRFDRDLTHSRGGYQHWAAHRAGIAGQDLQLAIETLRGGLLVGSLSTVQLDEHADRFSYGIGIGSWHWRCGYAADAITVLLALMFGQHGYRACEVSIYGSNFASQTLHARLGFREERRLLDRELSRYLITMSITADEFASRCPGFALPLQADRSSRGRHWRNLRGRHWQG
jgi:RimJ/RimL family protein N-acetyltransferase